MDLPASLALDYPTAAAIASHIASVLSHSMPADTMPAEGLATKAVPQRHRAVDTQLRRRVAAPQRHPGPPASSVIVGLSARFPGPAADAADFWHNINSSIDLPEQASAPYLLLQR